MGCNMSLTLHFTNSDLDSFLETWQPSPMIMMKSSIRISFKLKRSKVENGVLVCWRTTAEGRHHMAKIKRQKKRTWGGLINIFLDRVGYKQTFSFFDAVYFNEMGWVCGAYG